jgi:hypothetical protein
MMKSYEMLPGPPYRTVFNLSLRLDDDFECRLSRCLRRMPRGYAKQFFVRAARLFGRKVVDDDAMFRLMMDFVTDVKPCRLAELPHVAAAGGEGAVPQPKAKRQQQALPFATAKTEQVTGGGVLETRGGPDV